MGAGSYSSTTRTVRADSMGFFTKSSHEIFTERNINSAMSPYGVKIREARDSIEHPCTVPIILALDVTGSMGSVPHYLVKEGLPHIMDSIIQKGIKDPQLLFLAIGDHECDRSPLQIGQFESSDALLDMWLTKVYLEGGGGSNFGESYNLAWYVGAYHTAIDSWEKRKQKGFLFTIGDEPVLKSLPKNVLKNIMGDGQYQDFTSAILLDKAREMYDVYHLHVTQTNAGSQMVDQGGWKQLMGDNLILVNDVKSISKIISDIVVEKSKSLINNFPFIMQDTLDNSGGIIL